MSVDFPSADFLSAVLSPASPLRTEDVSTWWDAHRAGASRERTPFESAVLGGASADRLAWAFAAGYEAALARLLPERNTSLAAALCATEKGGAHPRAIATTFVDGVLEGEKTFVTLGSLADELLVLAKAGRGESLDGHAELVLVSVARETEGVILRSLGDLPFVPEIPHAEVRFDAVRGAVRVPGDGWRDHVRPFRTIEDVHVHAAFLAFWIAGGRRWGWPSAAAEHGAALLVSLAGLSVADPSSPSTHIALAGVIAATRALVTEHDASWASAPEVDRARWQRDRPLLEVAGKARALRLARAWERTSA